MRVCQLSFKFLYNLHMYLLDSRDSSTSNPLGNDRNNRMLEDLCPDGCILLLFIYLSVV